VEKYNDKNITWHIRYYYYKNSVWTYYTYDGSVLMSSDGKEIKDDGSLLLEFVPKLYNNELQVHAPYLSMSETKMVYPVVFAMAENEIVWA
jgi:hypothetical protein